MFNHMQRNVPAWERALSAWAALAWLPAGPLLGIALASAAMLSATGLAGFCPACAMAVRKL